MSLLEIVRVPTTFIASYVTSLHKIIIIICMGSAVVSAVSRAGVHRRL